MHIRARQAHRRSLKSTVGVQDQRWAGPGSRPQGKDGGGHPGTPADWGETTCAVKAWGQAPGAGRRKRCQLDTLVDTVTKIA